MMWAHIQNNLGNTLRTLGEAKGNSALLEEALEAFRQALLKYTRERLPHDWAMTSSAAASRFMRSASERRIRRG
jgi:Tetratricopeptide repeat